MKPTVGRIVLIAVTAALAASLNAEGANSYSEGEQIAAIVTRPHGENIVNCLAMVDGIGPKSFMSCPRTGTAGENYTGATWDWPAIATPMIEGESELMGGLDISKLLGGLDGILSTILITAYLTNAGKIGEAADKALTPSAKVIDRVCSTLRIPADKRPAILTAARAWGDKGGDLLEAIAAAKAGI